MTADLRRGGTVTAAFLVALARAISGARVRWLKELSDERQRVFFANHSSHLDFIVLWSALPERTRRLTRPVAGRDYWLRGAVRRYLASRVFNAILIDRHQSSADHSRDARAREAIDRMVTEMGDHYSLIVFPEGTRGSGADVTPFKSGLFHLCRSKPGLELIPVHLDNMNRILPKGESLPVPMLSRVTFGAPMWLDPGEEKAAFLERARAAVRSLGVA